MIVNAKRKDKIGRNRIRNSMSSICNDLLIPVINLFQLTIQPVKKTKKIKLEMKILMNKIKKSIDKFN